MKKRTVLRREYLEKLMRYKDQTDLIKVITGMRRCGKSTLLQQYIEMLISEGVGEDRIVYLNFQSKAIKKDILNEDSLYDHLMSRMSEETTYVFLDEVQKVTGWENVVCSLQIDADADVYVTGSNAYMLSTELSTYLTGRSISINMLPLSFTEFKELNELDDNEGAFQEYLSIGALPKIRSNMSKDDSLDIADATRSDIVLKDISHRKKLTDTTALEKIIDYLFSEIGNPISVNSISKELKIDNKTVDGYLKMICESLMFYEIKRYDMRGKIILSTLSKYYCTDLGMRNSAIGEYSRDFGRSIENVVYLELLRRGYSVRAGKLGNLEVDFVADKSGRREYYQVSMTLLDGETKKREIRPLQDIDDSNRKMILTMDRIGLGTEGGIEFINIIDWLLD